METSNHYYAESEGILYADTPWGRICVGFNESEAIEGQLITPIVNGPDQRFLFTIYNCVGSEDEEVLIYAAEEGYLQYLAERALL